MRDKAPNVLTSAFYLMLVVPTWVLTPLMLLPMVAKSQHQESDTIFTKNNDTLFVRLTEVGVKEIYYQLRPKEHTETYIFPKQRIAKISYSDGDIETFDSIRKSKRVRRARHRPITPFHQELILIPDDELAVRRDKYKTNIALQLPAGVVASQVGAGMIVSGIIVSIFSDQKRGDRLSTIGFVGGAGFSIPLLWGGISNAKKYKIVKMELRRRGLSAK